MASATFASWFWQGSNRCGICDRPRSTVPTFFSVACQVALLASLIQSWAFAKWLKHPRWARKSSQLLTFGCCRRPLWEVRAWSALEGLIKPGRQSSKSAFGLRTGPVWQSWYWIRARPELWESMRKFRISCQQSNLLTKGIARGLETAQPIWFCIGPCITLSNRPTSSLGSEE